MGHHVQTRAELCKDISQIAPIESSEWGQMARDPIVCGAACNKQHQRNSGNKMSTKGSQTFLKIYGMQHQDLTCWLLVCFTPILSFKGINCDQMRYFKSKSKPQNTE